MQRRCCLLSRQTGLNGGLYFSALYVARHQSGNSADVRLQFAQHGTLKDHTDNRFRPISDAESVFAFSISFNLSGGVCVKMERKPTRDSAVFTLALVQDPVVQFAAACGLTHMQPFWASYFSDAVAMLDWHYADFEIAYQLAQNYSQQLRANAESSISRD